MILNGVIVNIMNPKNATYPKIAIIKEEYKEIPVFFYAEALKVLEDFLKIGDEVTLQIQVKTYLHFDNGVELVVYKREEILEARRTETLIFIKDGKKTLEEINDD